MTGCPLKGSENENEKRKSKTMWPVTLNMDLSKNNPYKHSIPQNFDLKKNRNKLSNYLTNATYPILTSNSVVSF